MDGGGTLPIVDLFAADWDHERSRPGFTSRSVDVGIRLGGELLGATLYECPPGNRVWPYHLHYANEEMLLVVEGTPMRGRRRASACSSFAPSTIHLLKAFRSSLPRGFQVLSRRAGRGLSSPQSASTPLTRSQIPKPKPRTT
jgi:hypothetical protein